MTVDVSGLVISKLAESKTKSDKFIPYRDSTLTWLLKDNLGGNSRTVMMATVSPAADNYDETLSTLRYADRAKKIVTHAVINEDPNAKIIRELRAEVESLKARLQQAAQPEKLAEQLTENEKLMEEYSLTWDEKLQLTGQKQEDRRMALEKMGISVESTGIKVDKEKYFLVNLNADPSLNELLVYYLSGTVVVGAGDAATRPDILLSGLGIQAEHCRLELHHNTITLSPADGAKTCVNGKEIRSKTNLKNGDRILWGSNHFFRLNCPKATSSEGPDTPYDWRMAQEEVLMCEDGSRPIQDVIARLEKQHETEKKKALESQKKDFERQFEQMKLLLSSPTPGSAPTLVINPKLQSKMRGNYRRLKSTEEHSRQFLLELRESIIKANGYVREANLLCSELGLSDLYKVSMQVPAECLTPNRKPGSLFTEATVLTCRSETNTNRVMTLEMFENKLVDLREKYQSLNQSDQPESPQQKMSSSQVQDNHELIGVANVFLDVLFHDVKLSYAAPVISQQGKIVGRLHFDIQRIAGSFPQDREADALCDSEEDSGGTTEDEENSRSIKYRLRIHEVSGIAMSFSNDIYCSYSVWEGTEPVTVRPVYTGVSLENTSRNQTTSSTIFIHDNEITTDISEDFLEHCLTGAISIELYGMRNEKTNQSKKYDESLASRWSELTKKLSLSISIQELSDSGEYANVKALDDNDGAGGTFQLRQGQQRRVTLMIKPISRSGGLPLAMDNVVNVEIGNITARSKADKPLDSYQEIDLEALRERWSGALERRKEYLGNQIKSFSHLAEKTELELEREKSLLKQWVYLTEERNAVLAPAEDSGLPGAPSSQHVRPGIEQHSPTVFLDLSPEDLQDTTRDPVATLGWDSVLSEEEADTFIPVPLLHLLCPESGAGAVTSWDSSLHESGHLNRVTDTSQHCYFTVRVTVRLSHPVNINLVLRKRVCFIVKARESFTEQLRLRLMGSPPGRDCVGVIYEVVASVPRASEHLEDGESLAVLAASGNTDLMEDGVTHIEKYSKQVAAAVDEILKLEKIRQNVAFKNCLITKESQSSLSGRMKKTSSVPNIRDPQFSSHSLDDLAQRSNKKSFDGIEFDHSGRSESAQGQNKMKIPMSKTMSTLQEDGEMSLSQYQSFMSSGYESQDLSASTISSQSLQSTD